MLCTWLLNISCPMLVCIELGVKLFVTLILKKEHFGKVLDFSPISLCNVCYKIVTKLFANRLKHVLDALISKEKSGFIAGHTPLYNIIAVQEIVHYKLGPCESPLKC